MEEKGQPWNRLRGSRLHFEYRPATTDAGKSRLVQYVTIRLTLDRIDKSLIAIGPYKWTQVSRERTQSAYLGTYANRLN